MKKFKELYVWAMNMKLYMGIYFTAIIFFVSTMCLVQGKSEISYVTMLTVMVAATCAAILQDFILDSTCDYTKGIFFFRSLMWLVLSTLIVGVIAYAFTWFKGLPDWNYIIFIAIMAIAFISMLWGEKFEQEANTTRLNSELKNYQKK